MTLRADGARVVNPCANRGRPRRAAPTVAPKTIASLDTYSAERFQEEVSGRCRVGRGRDRVRRSISRVTQLSTSTSLVRLLSDGPDNEQSLRATCCHLHEIAPPVAPAPRGDSPASARGSRETPRPASSSLRQLPAPPLPSSSSR